MAKFTSLLLGEAPDPTIVGLDQGAQGLINSASERSMRPDEEFAADLNRGAGEAAQSLAQSEQAAIYDNRKLGMDDGYNSAIRQAYQARAGDSVGKMIRANEYKAKMQKADQMHRMSQSLMAQERVKGQNYAALTEAYNQQEASRAAFIGQLFQLGGTVMSMGAASRKTQTAQQPSQNVGGYGRSMSIDPPNSYGPGGEYDGGGNFGG